MPNPLGEQLMMIHIQKTACFQRPAPLVQTSFSQDKSHAETHLCSARTHAQEARKQTQDNREEIRGARPDRCALLLGEIDRSSLKAAIYRLLGWVQTSFSFADCRADII